MVWLAPAEDEFDRWHNKERVDPDSRSMWDKGPRRRRGIPPNWRDLLRVEPPDDCRTGPTRGRSSIPARAGIAGERRTANALLVATNLPGDT